MCLIFINYIFQPSLLWNKDVPKYEEVNIVFLFLSGREISKLGRNLHLPTHKHRKE